MRRGKWWGMLLGASVAACSASGGDGGNGMEDAGEDVSDFNDKGPGDTGPADTGPADTGPADDVPIDGTSLDVAPDGGATDSGTADSGLDDAGAADAGTTDTGPRCDLSEVNCDGVCVNTLTSSANCGACGNACPTSQMCSNGMCGVTCAAPTAVCRGMDGNQYCANLATDEGNCGGCGAACPTGQSCRQGVCLLVCPTGQVACDGSCVDTQTSAAHCGMCGRVCATPTNGAAVCTAGVCGATCNTGFADCDGDARTGCEVDTRASATHCGLCGRACAAPTGGSASCQNSVCVAACPAGQIACSDTCVNTQTSVAHCGQCGRACTAPTGGSVTCQAGSCVGACPSGQTLCDGVCVNAQTDSANCGTCGTVCMGGATCSAGQCSGTPTAMGDLQISSLLATNCAVVDHNAITSDDRGGIAISSQQLFYTGDGSTGRFSPVNVSGGTAVTIVHDGLVSDLTTGALYAFGTNATTEVTSAGGTFTHLLVLDPATGAFTGRSRALSRSINATAYGAVGIFSGAGRALVWAAGRVWDINLGSGAVTDRGALAQPAWFPCESYAIWGVAEQFGGQLYLSYRPSSGNTVVRTRVSDNSTATVATFSNLSDMCSFTVSPSRNRWYFHHEGSSQFGGSAETVGVCDAVINSPVTPVAGPVFQVQTLTTNNCASVEHIAVTGDDRGGIALTQSQVLYNGDASTGRFSAVNVSGGVALGRQYDGLVTDLATSQAYSFGTSSTAPVTSGGGTMTHLLALDGTSGALTGASVALSSPIVARGSTGIFAGYGRIIVLTAGRAYHVALPSGTVTDLGAMSPPAWNVCENWAIWGTAEFFGGTLYIDYVQGNNVMRTAVPGGTSTMITTVAGGLSDMCSFVVSPARGRWFFHYEGSGFAGARDETIGVCDAITNQGSTLRIDAMAATGCTVVDHASPVGDDRGGIALTANLALYSGDAALVRHSIDNLSGAAGVGRVIDGIVSNLAAQQAYAFGTSATTPVVGTGVSSVRVTHLIALDATAGTLTGAAIALSSPIAFTGTYGSVGLGIFSGMHRAIVFTNGRAYNIDLPAGTVTDLGAMSQPQWYPCENIAAWGVAEDFGGSLYMTYRQQSTQDIVRTRIPDGQTTTVARFTNLSDLCGFTVSPQRQRWYFHHEGTSQLSSFSDETMGFCAATVSTQ